MVTAAASPQLRPLGVGERLDASFKIFGRNFLPMAKAVLLLALPVGVIDALVSVSTALPRSDVSQSPFGTANTFTNVSANDVSAYIAGVLAVLVLSEVVTAIATATCYRIIGNSYLGHEVEWRAALRFGASRFLSIVWVVFLTWGAALLPASGVALLALVFAVAHLGPLAVIVGVVGGLGWVVFAIWFLTCARLAVPTLMMEDVRGWKAVRRSVALCRGHWWSVFGTQFVAGLIVAVFSVVVGIVLVVVAVVWRDNTTAAAVGTFLSRTASLVLATPFSVAVLVVLSIDLRVRKEGFDLQLLASQMGVAPTRSAMSFMRPQYGEHWGAGPWSRPPNAPGTPGYPPPTPGYPPPVPGYPPPVPGYPPPTPGHPPSSPSYPPPEPGDRQPRPVGYPPPIPPYQAPPPPRTPGSLPPPPPGATEDEGPSGGTAPNA